jgi:hypothetical protein
MTIAQHCECDHLLSRHIGLAVVVHNGFVLVNTGGCSKYNLKDREAQIRRDGRHIPVVHEDPKPPSSLGHDPKITRKE